MIKITFTCEDWGTTYTLRRTFAKKEGGLKQRRGWWEPIWEHPLWVWAEKFKEDLDSLHLPRRVRSTLSRLASIEWVEETRSDEGQYVEIAVRALDKPYPCYQGALQYSETLKMEDFNFRTWVEWMVSSQEAMIQILAVYEVGEKTFAALKLAGEKFLSET